VSEIIVLHPGEKEKGYSTTHVFRTFEGRAISATLPDDYRFLERYGFDIDTFTREAMQP
jgi:pilus assembly protein CpaF